MRRILKWRVVVLKSRGTSNVYIFEEDWKAIIRYMVGGDAKQAMRCFADTIETDRPTLDQMRLYVPSGHFFSVGQMNGTKGFGTIWRTTPKHSHIHDQIFRGAPTPEAAMLHVLAEANVRDINRRIMDQRIVEAVGVDYRK